MLINFSQAEDLFLPRGRHILVLPLSSSLPIEALFPREITGSYIELLDTKLGLFIGKEKIAFEQNRFVVDERYRHFEPLQVIRLTLKRGIRLSWRVNIDFQSQTSLAIKPALDFDGEYSPEKALYLSKICSLIYHDEIVIREILKDSYDFDAFYYFSKSTTHRLVRQVTQSHVLNMVFTFFRARRTVIDLQFTKLVRQDSQTKKYIIVLAFRGSNESGDWLTNLQARYVGFLSNKSLLVHRGFQATLKTFLRHIQKHQFQLGEHYFKFKSNEFSELNDHCKVIITGHSLGGAVATLLGCYLYDNGMKAENLEVYNFGSPPIGNLQFTEHYRNKFPIYRVVNSLDPVPMLSSITHLNHLGQLVNLPSNDGEMHSCDDYLDNLLDSLELVR